MSPVRTTKRVGEMGAGMFQLFIGDEGGSSIDTNRAARIDIFAITNLTAGPSGWVKLTNSVVLTNSQLLLEDTERAATAQRFFKVEERP